MPPAACAEFHLLPTPEGIARGLKPFSLFLKKDQRLIYKKRRHADATNAGPAVEDLGSLIYLVGYEEDHDYAHFATYAMLLPDGRIEWSSDYNHITEHERNLDAHPPRFYERWNP